MKKRFFVSLLTASVAMLSACSKSETDNQTTATSAPATSVFSTEQAKDNLRFSKDQYLKLIDHVAKGENVYYGHGKAAEACKAGTTLCVPRAETHDAIHLEIPRKWTNGFYPGVLWKLLAAKPNIDDFSTEEEATLLATAKRYQAHLYDETTRTSTHDLGFILYDSFGEALAYKALDAETKQQYIAALDTGRESLATRFSKEKGVIRSWDWDPYFNMVLDEGGKAVKDRFSLAKPWQFPVIVDNMMNLEYMLSSDSEAHQHIGYSHADTTRKHHYFYEPTDKSQQYPLAYHVYDYDSQRPGNWQGLGNISAWARGQGWSLYGFVTVAEAAKTSKLDLSQYADFDAHIARLIGTLEHYMGNDPVPLWDFFADRDNAYEYAEYVGEDTTIFSGVLGLCSKRIESNIMPYKGYRPILSDINLLSEESKQRLAGKNSLYGEPILQGDKVAPCGTKPYAASHKKIPRDTSAAALIASGLYQYATFVEDSDIENRAVALADKIMAKLTTQYRTDTGNGRPHSEALGFVLSEATGNMDNASEIDTPIVYGDFYFIEANMRKLAYAAKAK